MYARDQIEEQFGDRTLYQEYVGVPTAIDLATRMGITTWAPDSGKNLGLSLVLGGGEVRPIDMAQVHATFANTGRKVPLAAIRRVPRGPPWPTTRCRLASRCSTRAPRT